MENNTAKSFWESNPNIMYDNHQWTSNTYICEKVYERMNGYESNTFWLNWLTSSFLSNRKDLSLFSPGCGTGLHENFLAESGLFKEIDAFDISETSVAMAKQQSSTQIVTNYYVDDLNIFNPPTKKYDVVFCSGSLHHVKEIEVFLKKVYSLLKPDGIFVVNEYVGDCYGICNPRQLKIINSIFSSIDSSLRSPSSTKNGYHNYSLEWALSVDPSESVRSKLIVPFLDSYFDYSVKRLYGMNIFQYLYQQLNHDKFTEQTAEIKTIIDLILQFENILMEKEIIESDFLFAILTPKKDILWS